MQSAAFFAFHRLTHNQISYVDHITQFANLSGGYAAFEQAFSLFKRSVASREICELRNMVNVGYLIMRQAMERKESRGLHYTIDYPHVKK